MTEAEKLSGCILQVVNDITNLYRIANGLPTVPRIMDEELDKCDCFECRSAI